MTGCPVRPGPVCSEREREILAESYLPEWDPSPGSPPCAYPCPPGPIGMEPAASSFGLQWPPSGVRRKLPLYGPYHFAADKVSADAPSSSEDVNGGDDAICKTMSNEELVQQILKLRDEAVVLAQQRKAELLRWDATAKQRTMTWFNTSDDEIRNFLMSGIDATIRVLRGLQAGNFLRRNEENITLTGCSPNKTPGGVASVCPPDTKEHRILLALRFCEMRITTRTYGTDIINAEDSQLSTLVHEVTHFEDVFGSKDIIYGMGKSQANANQPGMRLNADSLAGYILGVTEFSGYWRKLR